MAGEAVQTTEQSRSAAEAAAQPEGPTAFHYLLSPETVFDRVGSVVLVLLVSLVAWLVVVTLTRRAENALRRGMAEVDEPQRRRYQRALTGLSLLANVLKWVIILGAVLGALVALGLGAKLLPVLAGAGVVGLAVGFGAQALIRDLISGLIVLLEGQYGVGDFVQTGAVTGQVVSVGLRVTVLRDLAGRTHFVPNGSITVVAVHDTPWTKQVVDVLLADPTQAEEAAKVLTNVAQVLAENYAQVFHVIGPVRVKRAGTSASLRLSVATFVEHDWVAKEELVTRLNAELNRAGLQLPEGRPPRVYPNLALWPWTPTAQEQDEGFSNDTQ
ncbi:MAG: mechanosensitive ion channel family protein [Armatimonadota bacterium]